MEDCDISITKALEIPQSGTKPLTHYGLVMQCGNIDPGQHWLRQWLVAWRHQAITWTNVDVSLKGFYDILQTISYEWLKISIQKLSLKIPFLNLFPHLPEGSELISSSLLFRLLAKKSHDELVSARSQIQALQEQLALAGGGGATAWPTLPGASMGMSAMGQSVVALSEGSGSMPASVAAMQDKIQFLEMVSVKTTQNRIALWWIL